MKQYTKIFKEIVDEDGDLIPSESLNNLIVHIQKLDREVELYDYQHLEEDEKKRLISIMGSLKGMLQTVIERELS
jgi:hypothetical protein